MACLGSRWLLFCGACVLRCKTPFCPSSAITRYCPVQRWNDLSQWVQCRTPPPPQSLSTHPFPWRLPCSTQWFKLKTCATLPPPLSSPKFSGVQWAVWRLWVSREGSELSPRPPLPLPPPPPPSPTHTAALFRASFVRICWWWAHKSDRWAFR